MKSLTAAQIHSLAVLPLEKRASVLALVSIDMSFSHAYAIANA